MFCDICHSLMQKETDTGEIVFRCICTNIIKGTPTDTLMHEEIHVTANDTIKYRDMLQNAPFDKSRNLIRLKCPKCPLPFMTTLRVGQNETVYYACECGYKATKTQYDLGKT